MRTQPRSTPVRRARCRVGLVAAATLTGLTACTTVTDPPATTILPMPTGDPSQDVAAVSPIPGEFHAGFFIADATIDGVPGFRMVIDTGADATVLTPEAARRLPGMSETALAPTFGAGGRAGLVRAQREIQELRLGEVAFAGFDAAIIDLAPVRRALDTPVDGVIGWPAFRDCVLVMDYPTQAVTIESPSAATPPSAGAMPLVGRRATVRVPIHGRDRTVLVDTGAAIGLALSDRDLPKDAYTVKRTMSVRGVNGATAARVVELNDPFSFAGVTFDRVEVAMGRGSPTIGYQLMRHFTVRFDQPSGLIDFIAASPPTRDPATRGPGLDHHPP